MGGLKDKPLAVQIGLLTSQIGATHRMLDAAEIPAGATLEQRMNAMVKQYSKRIAWYEEIQTAHAIIDNADLNGAALGNGHPLPEWVGTLLELLNNTNDNPPPLTDNTLMMFFRGNLGARKADAWRHFGKQISQQAIGARVNKLVEEDVPGGCPHCGAHLRSLIAEPVREMFTDAHLRKMDKFYVINGILEEQRK